MKTFLLIDDHHIVRSGIGSILSEIFYNSTVHEASDGQTATEQLKLYNYDLIMMDIQLPKTDALGMMEYIHVTYPKAKVLIFSMGSEAIYAKRFLKAGAMGFLSKEAPLEDVRRAINTVLEGRKYISESLGTSLVEESLTFKPGKPGNHFERLSPREFEIVSLLLAGETPTSISKALNLQLSTVGTHKTRIFQKLGITNIIELKELALFYNL